MNQNKSRRCATIPSLKFVADKYRRAGFGAPNAETTSCLLMAAGRREAVRAIVTRDSCQPKCPDALTVGLLIARLGRVECDWFQFRPGDQAVAAARC